MPSNTLHSFPAIAEGLAPEPPHLVLVREGHPDRATLEAFIARTYKASYGATIARWMPALVGLVFEGELVAAAGYRNALSPLYLERYLSQPIERMVENVTGQCVSRAAIVEVGHFASARPGAGRKLMRMLADHLHQVGCRFVSCTATHELRDLLSRVGLAPLALAPADPKRVEGGGTAWGSYYEHDPVVVIGDVGRARAALAQRWSTRGGLDSMR